MTLSIKADVTCSDWGGGHVERAYAIAARDAVKEALRRAGIGYEEVVGGHHTPAELRRVVERLVQRIRATAS